MSQNTSHAVMAQRAEPHDSLDYFPTPPWAGRALCEHVLIGGEGGWAREELKLQMCWEPACGEGHLVRALDGYFASVKASDIHAYAHGQRQDFHVHDFLMMGATDYQFDWIITNPPFRLGVEFVERGLEIARVGVAMLVRSAFVEGADRYRRLFAPECGNPAAIYAPFVERVPMVKGRCDPKASSATAYCWLVWSKMPRHAGSTRVCWIPPCRRQLERPGDYAIGSAP